MTSHPSGLVPLHDVDYCIGFIFGRAAVFTGCDPALRAPSFSREDFLSPAKRTGLDDVYLR